MPLSPCKHLDHTTEYIDCELIEIKGFKCSVYYWQRNNPPYPTAPTKVQFCGLGKGRIDGIFQCYNGEMPCYSPCSNDNL